jgi:hypothetical protein
MFGNKEHPAQFYITQKENGQYALISQVSTGDSRELGASFNLNVTLEGAFKLLECHPEFVRPVLH